MAAEWMTGLQIATPIIVGGVGYLIRRSIAQMDERQNKTDERIERLEQESVSKEDWLRESGIARQRQEKVLEELAELKGQNRAGVEIGAAIAAALNQRRIS